MAKSTDEAVLELLKKVEQKRAEIKKAQKRPQYKTNLTIGYDPETTTGRIMIQTVTDPSKVAGIYAFLIQKEEALNQAYTELGLPPDLTYMGYPIADWKEDLKARAGQLSIEQKKKELDILDKRVNSLVSPEQRREMELAALTAELAE
jgi:hypothetical protein